MDLLLPKAVKGPFASASPHCLHMQYLQLQGEQTPQGEGTPETLHCWDAALGLDSLEIG